MTMPLMKPRRKNPVLRTRQMNLPPCARGRTALGMTAAAAEGRFELQVCQRCRAVQYPPRDACHRCLSSELKWTPQDGAGELLSETVLHHSNDPFYRERLPWRLGLVRLDCRADGDRPPARRRRARRRASTTAVRVHVGARLDRAGAAVLIGFPPEESEHMADDTMLREMTSDPKFRKILVTDGKTEVGQALVRALVKAGAEIVWVGHAEPWKKLPGLDDITRAAAGDARAARPHRRPLGRPSSPARSAARSTSSSTTPRCIAPSASRRGAAPTRPAPRWTSTTSACCAWRRNSARR